MQKLRLQSIKVLIHLLIIRYTQYTMNVMTSSNASGSQTETSVKNRMS